MDRRSFLGRGIRRLGAVAALGVIGPTLLEACSGGVRADSAGVSGGAASTNRPGSLGALHLQGPWVSNAETGGEYIAAARGYWLQQGFSSVTIMPGGPNVSPEKVVEAGSALVGVTSLDAAAAAIRRGADLIVIGAQYQKNPFAIMSPADAPLRDPQDVIGKKIGVQPANDAVWASFLTTNNIKASQVEKVAVGSDPTPMTRGVVDGWMSFIDNEPIMLPVVYGYQALTFLLADYNEGEVGNVYVATRTSLGAARDKLKAAMVGDILGWKDALTNPAEIASLAVEHNGGLARHVEQVQADIQGTQLIAVGDALAHGLFYIAPDSQAANVDVLAGAGTTITAQQLFDMTLLDEIYDDDNLKTVPTPVSS